MTEVERIANNHNSQVVNKNKAANSKGFHKSVAANNNTGTANITATSTYKNAHTENITVTDKKFDMVRVDDKKTNKNDVGNKKSTVNNKMDKPVVDEKIVADIFKVFMH